MARLIDANLLTNHLDDCIAETDGQTPIVDAVLRAIKCAVEQMPTVDAVPVVHGEWIEEPYLLGTTHRCNRCWENFGMPHGIFNYCPNCGAKMDGVNDR